MLTIAILIVILLTVINGLLAASEMAIVSSRKARLETMASDGSRGARAALTLLKDPGGFLSTVQIGITFIGVIAGAYSGATLADPFGDWLDGFAWIAPNGDAYAIGIVVLLITYLSLIVGELVPKRIALTNPEGVASAIARPMRILSLAAAPAVWLLRHSSDLVLRLLGLTGARDATVTEEEVKSLIAEGTRTGVFAPEEREMIEGVLRLGDRSVRSIMTPRAEIAWIAVDARAEEVVARLRSEHYTQLLVCEGTIDHPIGLIDASDVISSVLDKKDCRLAEIIRKVPVIPEQTSVFRLLELFRREREHFAVIVDEYGTTQGVVTSTDILESIAGDLPEKGEESAPIVRRDDGSWLVDGLLPIDEFQDLVERRNLRADGDFETLAGFVIERLGHLPQAGEKIIDGDLTIEVVDMDGRRIDKVLVTRNAAPDAFAGD